MDIKELRKMLFAFVAHATSRNATPEEIAALPEVARVLLDTFACRKVIWR